MGRDGRAAGGAGGAGCVLQKLAMFGIAEIETLTPVVRPGQIRPGHYSLGFASLKGEPGGALRFDNGGDRVFAIHLDDG